MTEENLKNEKQKNEKLKTPSIASVFRKIAQQENKDIKDIAEKIVKHFTDLGITKNMKGKVIELSKVENEVKAMFRDIKIERGKEKGSWWASYNIVQSIDESKPSLKIVKKEIIN